MNWRNRKLWLLLLAGGALIALLILAAGITTVEFEKGISLGSVSLRRDQGAISFQAGSGDLLKVFGFVIMALLPATIVYLMLSPEARRRFLINLIQLGIFLLFLYYLSTQLGKKEGESTLQLPEGFKQPEITDPGMLEKLSFENFSAKDFTWLVYLLSFLVAALLLLLAYKAWQSWQRRRRQAAIQESLVSSAQSALHALRSGQDFGSVILRCYHDMGQAAQEKRGVVRQEHITPREFTPHLENAGLPPNQVERLTHLFESARYSTNKPTPQQETEALDCLKQVIRSLGAEA